MKVYKDKANNWKVLECRAAAAQQQQTRDVNNNWSYSGGRQSAEGYHLLFSTGSRTKQRRNKGVTGNDYTGNLLQAERFDTKQDMLQGWYNTRYIWQGLT
jgi:hypothetical protein